MNSLTNTNGKPSGTKFWFSFAAAVSCFKFLFSNITIGSMAFGAFDSTGASMLLTVLGGMYGYRRYTEAKFIKDENRVAQ